MRMISQVVNIIGSKNDQNKQKWNADEQISYQINTTLFFRIQTGIYNCNNNLNTQYKRMN
jgi:hypothetical protein